MMMPARVREWWLAGSLAGLVYGGLLVMVAMDSAPGAPLNGQIAFQPVWKTAMALLLARAARFHPARRERYWLMAALLFSALGDFLLALPWLPELPQEALPRQERPRAAQAQEEWTSLPHWLRGQWVFHLPSPPYWLRQWDGQCLGL